MKSKTPSRLSATTHPIVLEVNARVLIRSLSDLAGHAITLGTIPEEILETWSSEGLDAIWLMGVWTTGEIGRQKALEHQGLMDEYKKALPDVTPEDVIGSPYAVQAYEVSPILGGENGLKELRSRLASRGIGVVLDFVCNHTACDHAWVIKHPEYYVQGSSTDARKKPDEFFTAKTSKGEKYIAYGRDPYFSPWTDTAQLNYASNVARRALVGLLKSIATMCDGVRCDMAMLVLEDVFQKTWEGRTGSSKTKTPGEFWEKAISQVKLNHAGFLFLAESYWDMEWKLQQLGFDFTYDKKLYDRLIRQDAGPVREHLKADMEYQRRSIRFIENHDEPPIASAMPSEGWHHAAAIIASTVPGMLLVHEGQLEGRRVRLPVQLGRCVPSAASEETRNFYRKLFAALDHPVFHSGTWMQLNPFPAWQENSSNQNFLSFWWQHESEGIRLVVVNYATYSSQCYVELPVGSLPGAALGFRDLMGPAVYVRAKESVLTGGMFFDLNARGFHIFEVSTAKPL